MRWLIQIIFSINLLGLGKTKTVQINIDSEDLSKLFYELTNSDTFRRFSTLIQRSRTQPLLSDFKNPYHPEDIITHIDVPVNNQEYILRQIKSISRKKQGLNKTIENKQLERIGIDADLERENDIFISGKGYTSDDILLENEKETASTTASKSKTKISSIARGNTHFTKQGDIQKSDKYDYKPLQRRYVLKRS
ncbi:hypothetical protein K1T71_006694 [Dendrolimus kikuchii]|uniref:Uncharacterized protein n=1 Tax=Dendrolimus kikuchii TaxID=765133 RepID=A0ACC1D1V3_9NEOP|nr:hypothetical protein K1T71_006694 [Dendrolimus kikuchii]